MERLTITIEIATEVDPSTVLDLSQEAAEALIRELRSYGLTVAADVRDATADCVSVSYTPNAE